MTAVYAICECITYRLKLSFLRVCWQVYILQCGQVAL